MRSKSKKSDIEIVNKEKNFSSQIIKNNRKLTKEDLKSFKSIFIGRGNEEESMKRRHQFLELYPLFFLQFLSTKLQLTDYEELIHSLTFITKEAGSKIIEKRKKNQIFYILVDGELGLYLEADESQQLVLMDQGQVGNLYCSSPYMTPRNSGFTVVCEDTCSFLTFNEEIYQKYIKKLLTKQIDEQIHILKTNALFHDVGTLNLRKYCSYFVKKSYKYNEIIYSPHSATEYIYFIQRGEVQLNHQHSEKNINVVRLIQGECFGFENDQFGEVKSYAKNVSPELSVLRIHVFIFQTMMKQLLEINLNLAEYLEKTGKVHRQLVSKNAHIQKNKKTIENLFQKKKKKGKKLKFKKKWSKNSLKWWGLADNVPAQQKLYPPRTLKKRSDRWSSASLSKQIQDLRKKVFESDLKNNKVIENDGDEERTLGIRWKTTNYVPKMKAKVKMLEVKPKVVDMTQIIKKKLLTYAKNVGSFCDRLNLD